MMSVRTGFISDKNHATCPSYQLLLGFFYQAGVQWAVHLNVDVAVDPSSIRKDHNNIAMTECAANLRIGNAQELKMNWTGTAVLPRKEVFRQRLR